MKKRFTTCMMVAGALATVGCATEPGDDAAPTAEPSATATAMITSVNADGTWTANATGTAGVSSANNATGVFTGPSGKTRKMGVCLLKEFRSADAWGNPVPHACTTVTDCANAPATLPTGGSRYCLQPNNAGQAYCFFRQGAQTSYCAGSPALGGTPVSPGTYTTPTVVSGKGVFISDACFEGCAVTDPSSSSAEQATPDFTSCKTC